MTAGIGKPLTCTRCGHQWHSARAQITGVDPKTCPRCNSPYWHRPRMRPQKQQKGA